jgi:hypothetical protein
MSKKKRQATARRASKKVFGRTAAAPRKSTAVRKSVAGAAEKLDLYKKHKNEYLASLMPSFVRVGPAMYLAYDGTGRSGATPEFANGIGAMYNVAFTMKMAYKSAGKDYAVTKLEALWSPKGDGVPNQDTIWDWTLLIRVPTFVTGPEVSKTIDGLIAKGKPQEIRSVKLIELHEDQCVQILHVGSYQEEGPTIEKMKRFAEISGRKFTGRHHEIYLSDPRKVAGEKLRTILRQPVA